MNTQKAYALGFKAGLRAAKYVTDFYVRDIPEFAREKLGMNSDGKTVYISNGIDWELLAHKENGNWLNDNVEFPYDNFSKELPELADIFDKEGAS